MDIYLDRGDVKSFTIPLVKEGAVYTLQAGDVLTFTAKVRQSDIDTSAVFQKETGDGITQTTGQTSAVVKVLNIDTKNREERSLFWDIQVVPANEENFTAAKGVLYLSHDVTRELTPSVTIYSENPITAYNSLTSRIAAEESTRLAVDASLASQIGVIVVGVATQSERTALPLATCRRSLVLQENNNTLWLLIPSSEDPSDLADWIQISTT